MNLNLNVGGEHMFTGNPTDTTGGPWAFLGRLLKNIAMIMKATMMTATMRMTEGIVKMADLIGAIHKQGSKHGQWPPYGPWDLRTVI